MCPVAATLAVSLSTPPFDPMVSIAATASLAFVHPVVTDSSPSDCGWSRPWIASLGRLE
jgi:hypothetical protein